MDRDRVTVGGVTTTDEMCETFLLYYPATDLFIAESAPPVEYINDLFGFNNVTVDALVILLQNGHRLLLYSRAYSNKRVCCFFSLISSRNNISDYYVVDGVPLKEYMKDYDWDNFELEEYQHKTRYGAHAWDCFSPSFEIESVSLKI